ncbi:hypothetical protein DFP72DRAFT_1091245 [Ephemerocybe angulata]|uniref:RING-type domain-containing protein n=1 Tax=Ephemerocybe angulata TaxID=980116 RepID=A0A8H6HFZ4_9AGAR|nr:hypothetical protein DFP72DRAFT_1091245 [Tulosesus angulatus]
MQILTTPSTPTDATINIQTQATLSTPSDISLNIEALAHAGLSAPADASVKHRSTALPACAICTNLLHPTHRPAKRIVCGHTYCRECVQTLCSLGQGCPGKCRGNRRLRPRDVRTLHISIAPTSESEDDEAALSVIMALLAKRTRLEGLEVSETEESDRVSKCIANQLSTLRRFTSISKKAFSAKKQAVSELKAIDEELRVAIDNEGKLLSELSVVQCQLRAVRREVPQLDLDGNAANMNIHAANMNTMTDIRLTLKRTLAETGDEIDGSPCPSKRARTPEAQDVPGPSSPRAIRPRPRPIRPVTIQLSSPHDLPYIFIGIQLNPAPMGFRGNSKKDPSPSVAPAPPSRREEDSPASENASACPSDSGFGERRSGGDGELASSSISGALQHQFQPGILARLVCLLGVDNLESTTCFGGMLRCVDLLPPPDDISFLKTVHTIYVQHHKFPEALSVAIRLNDPDLIREDFNAPGNPLMKRQLAFLLARARIPLEWLPDDNTGGDADVDFADDLPEDLLECLSNTRLSTHFREFEKGGVADAKTSEDVYKSHLENTGLAPLRTSTPPEVTWLAFSSIALVNAGFGSDKLMVEAEEGNSWTYKNKDHGIQCRCISSSQLVVGHRLTSTSTPTHRRRTSRRSSCHWYSGKADSEDKSLDESWERYMALGLGLQDSSDTSKPSTTQYRRRRRSSLRLAPSLAPVAFSASRPCSTGILWETSRDDPETVQPRAIRKSVPLAIGLISASNPQLPVLDTLSRYSHDNDMLRRAGV